MIAQSAQTENKTMIFGIAGHLILICDACRGQVVDVEVREKNEFE